MHKVMNCKEYTPDKLKPNSLASFKFDGVRAFYYPGKPYLISRDNKRLYGFNHIITPLHQSEYNHVIDMELMIPGYDDWNKMAGAIRNHSACPDAYGLVLDIPSMDVPFTFRRERFHTLMSITPHLNITSQFVVSNDDEVQGIYKMALIQGHEGIVIKTPNHKYRNTRSHDWMRLVPVQTYDGVCTGIYEGKGKMENMAGGIYIRWRDGTDIKVGTMKGIDMQERKSMLWFADDYIGRTAEIHYKELQPSGKPRQPRFKRWRDDK